MQSETDLIAACAALVGDLAKLSAPEREVVSAMPQARPSRANLAALRKAILAGDDPLGEAFVRVRSASRRRGDGAVYTPGPIVRSMMTWLASQGEPERIVDPGAGSGRFLLAAGAAFPRAQLVAVEMDPLAALMLRANLAVQGWADRASVIVKDYRQVTLPRVAGTTAFIGNPPYVRHHDIAPEWKRWYASAFAKLGIKASALAGLHLHFFLKTRLLARKGDVGAFITSSEWMDVNYGSALRRLLLEGLGGIAVHVLEPTVEAFPGTATTAAITCFRMGEARAPVRVRAVKQLAGLNGLTKGKDVPRATLGATPRWSIIVRPSPRLAGGEIELGELFRVHRGQVTGGNSVWIAGEAAMALPSRLLVPAVTKARDLIAAGQELTSAALLRRVVDLPADLDSLTTSERRRVETFLAWAKTHGADQSYIARHRRAWWSVGLRPAAPVLCTYMARRPPQFTINACAAGHINVAHGLYPRQPIDPAVLARLVVWLNSHTGTASGRTYAGGLTKFEPREVERLRLPGLDQFAR